jgi:hypothetical protein
MKLEKMVLAVGGTSMAIGAIAGISGMVISEPGLKSLAVYALGFGVVVGCIPIVLLLAAIIFEKKRG